MQLSDLLACDDAELLTRLGLAAMPDAPAWLGIDAAADAAPVAAFRDGDVGESGPDVRHVDRMCRLATSCVTTMNALPTVDAEDKRAFAAHVDAALKAVSWTAN